MRIFVFLIVAVIALVISAVKRSIGTVTKNEDLKNSSLADEAKTVMDKTAKGISWMEQQWEESKRDANSDTTKGGESPPERPVDVSKLPDTDNFNGDKD